ncbi:MAG: hypothetical protein IPF54_21675 [Draconibacterium sp.]|nr:hypothetical protein [Draconibacterium sp.]
MGGKTVVKNRGSLAEIQRVNREIMVVGELLSKPHLRGGKTVSLFITPGNVADNNLMLGLNYVKGCVVNFLEIKDTLLYFHHGTRLQSSPFRARSSLA